MKAITVSAWSEAPKFTADAPSPPAPADDSTVQLKVLAAGLHSLVRAQATGQHYSVTKAPLPYIPGADGVGQSPTGELLYFNSIATGGAFAETINVPRSLTTPVPAGADPVKIAGLLNPGMASWMALRARISPPLPKDFTVLILGATALAGKVAVHFSRLLGAGRVIGLARSAGQMKALGLDDVIELREPATETDFSVLNGTPVDLVLDYLYGNVVGAVFAALQSPVSTQYVQVGTVAGTDATLPGAVLRSKDITMRGTGPGAWSMQHFAAELPGLLDAVTRLPDMALTVRPLEEADAAWANKRERAVFVP